MFPECIKACRKVVEQKIDLFNDADKTKLLLLNHGNPELNPFSRQGATHKNSQPVVMGDPFTAGC
jgi:hypothetical protein